MKKVLPADRARVFRAWTDKEELARWFAPASMTTEIHEFDLREGGAYRLTMKGKDGDHTVGGVFRQIIEPEKLSMTFQWEEGDENGGPGAEMLIEVSFADVDGGTEMTFVQSGFGSERFRDMHEQGWTSTFDKLAAELS